MYSEGNIASCIRHHFKLYKENTVVQTSHFCCYSVPVHQNIITDLLMISYARWQWLSKDLLAWFSLVYSFTPYYGSGDHSVSDRNEYKEYVVGGKDGRCVGLTSLPSSCEDFLQILKEWISKPSGPVQTCIGIALPVPIGTNRWQISVFQL